MESEYGKSHFQKMELASYQAVRKTTRNKDNEKELQGKYLVNS